MRVRPNTDSDGPPESGPAPLGTLEALLKRPFGASIPQRGTHEWLNGELTDHVHQRNRHQNGRNVVEQGERRRDQFLEPGQFGHASGVRRELAQGLGRQSHRRPGSGDTTVL